MSTIINSDYIYRVLRLSNQPQSWVASKGRRQRSLRLRVVSTRRIHNSPIFFDSKRTQKDLMSSENDISRTRTPGSMVAVFSAELSSWGGPFCISQQQDNLPQDATGPSVPVPPPIPPEIQSESPASIPVVHQVATVPLKSHPFYVGQRTHERRQQQQQEHAQPRGASSRSDDSSLSPNALIDVASHHQPPAPPTPPQSSDTTPHGFFENQNPTFNTALPAARRQSGVTSNWTQQSSVGFGQPLPSSEDLYTLLSEQFFPVTATHSFQQPQQQYLFPVDHLTPGLPRTPVSDAALQSRQSISRSWTDNQRQRQPGPGLPNLPTGWVIFQQTNPKRKRARGKAKQRKRQKSETDTDDDDDVVGPNVGANMPRPYSL